MDTRRCRAPRRLPTTTGMACPTAPRSPTARTPTCRTPTVTSTATATPTSRTGSTASLPRRPGAEASATALMLKGDKAIATVTANGAAPTGTVTFSVGGKSKTKAVVSGKATAKLPSVPPGSLHRLRRVRPLPAKPADRVDGDRVVHRSPDRDEEPGVRELRGPRPAESARPGDGPGGFDVSGKVKIILKRNGQTIKKATVRLSSLESRRRSSAELRRAASTWWWRSTWGPEVQALDGPGPVQAALSPAAAGRGGPSQRRTRTRVAAWDLSWERSPRYLAFTQ